MATRLFLALSLMVILSVAGSLVPWTAQAADSQDGQAMTVFVVEGDALRSSPGATERVSSLVSLYASLEPDRPVAFIDAERPSSILGPVAPSDIAFGELVSRVNSELSSGTGAGDNLVLAVAEAATLLGLERASTDSEVVIVVGIGAGAPTASLVERLTPLINRIADRGFNVTAVAASNSERSTSFASHISTVADGKVLNASSSDSLMDLAGTLLSGSSAGLDDLGNFQRSQGEILNFPVVVAPGTVDLKLIALRDGSGGSIRLVDPSGTEVSRDAASALNPDYVSAWNVQGPEHGIWMLESGGLGGSLSIWGARANGIQLSMETPDTLPLGEPVDLVASARPLPALPGQAAIYAHIEAPDGAPVTYILRDDGVDPDVVAGDGYFSGSVAPFNQQGSHAVVLELLWQGTDYRVNSQQTFRVQLFPSVNVESLVDGPLTEGLRTHVAVVSVTVDGQPYAVTPESITLELSGESSEGQSVEAVPRELSSAGEGWIFDVYATFDGPGSAALSMGLNLVYAGTDYSNAGDFIVLGIPQPLAPAAPEQTSEPAPTPTGPEDASFPWWVLTFPALLLATLLVVMARWLITPAPVGYLLDDDRQLVADFSAVRRSLWERVLFRNAVAGKRLGLPGLDGATFVFERGAARVRVGQPSTTVRVEGIPLEDQADLDPQTWIGTSGRAYIYTVAEPA